MPFLSVPTTLALSSDQLVPSQHPAVIKTLQRLSRPSLLTLALDWLDDRNAALSNPVLLREDEEQDEQDFYPPVSSLDELRDIYTDLQSRKGGKRDVVDRILEGDWRDGLSLYQLAMADMQHLYDHPASQKWTALKIVRLQDEENRKSVPSIPRFHPATFLQNLRKESLPDVKAHFNLDRHPSLPLTILRVFVLESPYNTSLALQSTKQQAVFDQSKTFYVAFPDASSHVFVSLTTILPAGARGLSSENRSLRNHILSGIPKAFSKARERYKLESTSLSARNMEALVEKRGGGRMNAAGGGWSVYAAGVKARDNPLNIQLPTPESAGEESSRIPELGLKRKREQDDDAAKRRRMFAQGRFGKTAKKDDGKGIEYFHVKIEDPFSGIVSTGPIPGAEADDRPLTRRRSRRSNDNVEDVKYEVEEDDWVPDTTFTFHGAHVFAGIRELVELGIVDGDTMPGWMTGEEGVSIGTVKNGRIVGFKGSGV